jgi:hypothetical protein
MFVAFAEPSWSAIREAGTQITLAAGTAKFSGSLSEE